MKQDLLRLGLIGASPGRGWSWISHLPALAAIDCFRIAAVATTRRESAEQACAALQADQWFDDPLRLTREADVDAVSVVVKVPDHFAIVMAALDAGKHVYCEWPLALSSADAKAIADLARRRGLQVVVGLQARMAPEVQALQRLVEAGDLGDLLSVSAVASTASWGGTIASASRYILDKRQGATALSIIGGHTLDAIAAVAGAISSVSATVRTVRKHVQVADTGQVVAMTSPDQIAVSGTLANGAVLGLQIRAGCPRSLGLRLDLVGAKGEASLSADGNIQMSRLTLTTGAAGRIDYSGFIDPSLAHIAGTPSYNVAMMYKALASAIGKSGVERDDKKWAPVFVAQSRENKESRARCDATSSHLALDHQALEDAVTNHRLLDAIARSSDTASRQDLA